MEVKRKERTLAGEFSKYIAIFCLGTIANLLVSFLLFGCMNTLGLILPANAAEHQLIEMEEEISSAAVVEKNVLPYGCSFGVYDVQGSWLYGTLDEGERSDAWRRFEGHNKYAKTSGFYRFISRTNGEVCIVKYHLVARYSRYNWNRFLPPPETLLILIFLCLFLINAYFMSRLYAKNMKRRLLALNEVTEKIADNNLDFAVKKTDIKEVNQVMTSLDHMKNALRDSLERQWAMEEQKKKQLAALTHDIKTPLTIIRGNAELMAESELSEEDRECNAYILQNVEEIEHYQQAIRDVLQGSEEKTCSQRISCCELGNKLCNAAEQLSAIQKVKVLFDINTEDRYLNCNEEQILRAWTNIVSNALEYTDKGQGIHVTMMLQDKEDVLYFAAKVRDFGFGFSDRDLRYADQEFYSGDISRHDRRHQGMGLAIAKQFIENQGGYLQFGNVMGECGAAVSLNMRIDN